MNVNVKDKLTININVGRNSIYIQNSYIFAM